MRYCPHRHTEKIDGLWRRGDDDILGILHMANGGRQIKAHCRTCSAKSGAIPEAVARVWVGDLDALPSWNQPVTEVTCIVRGCTTVGSEFHHFAPVNVFGWEEADRWPYLALCRPHHVEWHNRMDGYQRNGRRS